MRVVMLASSASIHSRRWAEALASCGIEITLVTQDQVIDSPPPPGVELQQLPHGGASGYFRNAMALRRILRERRPHLLHAHYASGYGTTAALAHFDPTLLSVWGSDVFEFPTQSRLKAMLLKSNLRRASRIASTSVAMAQRVMELTPDVAYPFVTPFGVDCELFAPRPDRDLSLITVGTVKTLEARYGVDLLIKAFALLQQDRTLEQIGAADMLRLTLVGGGPARAELEALASGLCAPGTVQFVGPVPHHDVPRWLNTFDIYVAASRMESFGVAVIEASACGVPVVVTRVGGLPEVVQHGHTGLIVPPDDVEALATAIRTLATDQDQRRSMAEAGRMYAAKNYSWAHCVEMMRAVYEKVACPATHR